MKAFTKLFFVASIVSFSVFAQAEGVSHEDIEAGNNPATVTIEIRNPI